MFHMSTIVYYQRPDSAATRKRSERTEANPELGAWPSCHKPLAHSKEPAWTTFTLLFYLLTFLLPVSFRHPRICNRHVKIMNNSWNLTYEGWVKLRLRFPGTPLSQLSQLFLQSGSYCENALAAFLWMCIYCGPRLCESYAPMVGIQDLAWRCLESCDIDDPIQEKTWQSANLHKH